MNVKVSTGMSRSSSNSTYTVLVSHLPWPTYRCGSTTSNLRRKPIYRQMALIIAGGPAGKGIRMVHPNCIVQGIRLMFPAEDNKYMGHMEN